MKKAIISAVLMVLLAGGLGFGTFEAVKFVKNKQASSGTTTTTITVTVTDEPTTTTTTAHSHTFDTEWSYDDETHYHECIADDGAKINIAAHDYESTVTKEATATEEGEVIYTCTVCGYSYTEVTRKLTSYTITFKNYDGTTLQTVEYVLKDELPSYTGETPTREYDDDYLYSFKGWNEEIKPATEDYTYYAEYDTIVNAFTVTWLDYDGIPLVDKETYKYGETPSYKGETPTRDKDKDHTYQFNGWDREIEPVSENTSYTATYLASDRIYTVNFDLDGGTSSSSKTTADITSFSKDVLFYDVTKEGYKFSGWTVDGTQVVDENGNIVKEVTLKDNMTFTAYFIKQVTVTFLVDVSEKCSITLSGDGAHLVNETITLSASDDANGYATFVGFYLNNTLLSAEKECSYNVGESDSAVEIRYELKKASFTISENKDYAGTISIDGSEAVTSSSFESPYFTEIGFVATPVDGADFIGWYIVEDSNEETLYSTEKSITYTPDGTNASVKLTAKYDCYKIDYVVDEKTTLSKTPSYFSSKGITYSTASKAGYDFAGWSETSGSSTAVTIDLSDASNLHDYTLYPIFTPRTDTKYQVKHMIQTNVNALTYEESVSQEKTGTTDSLTSASVYSGISNKHIWTGTIEQKTIEGDGSTIVYVYYNYRSATVKVSAEDSTLGTATVNGNDTSSGSITVKYFSYITLNATAKDPILYEFAGWYNKSDDTLFSSTYNLSFQVTTKNIDSYNSGSWSLDLVAKFTKKENVSVTVTLKSDDTTLGTKTIAYGDATCFGTASAATTLYSSKKFVGWTINGVLVTDSQGTLTSPWNYHDDGAATATLTASFETPSAPSSDDVCYLYFGRYPQTLVTNDTVKGLLKSNIGTLLPSSSNLNGWTDYNYMQNDTVTSFMYYRDIDLDGDGSNDYRAVYFTDYRPRCIGFDGSASYSLQDDNGYTKNNIYYFSYDQIEWIAIKGTGAYMMTTKMALDSQNFNSSISGNANDYSASSIRSWIINQFLSTAFTAAESTIIQSQEIENGSYGKTTDKAYLMSSTDAYIYALCNELTHMPTDYAKCQGIQTEDNGSATYGSPVLERTDAENDGNTTVYVYAESGAGSSKVRVDDSSMGVSVEIVISK